MARSACACLAASRPRCPASPPCCALATGTCPPPQKHGLKSASKREKARHAAEEEADEMMELKDRLALMNEEVRCAGCAVGWGGGCGGKCLGVGECEEVGASVWVWDCGQCVRWVEGRPVPPVGCMRGEYVCVPRR